MTARPDTPLDRLMGDEAQRLRLPSVLAVASSLLWLPQAALIAALIAGFIAGETLIPPLVTGLALATLTLARALLSSRAEALLFAVAEDFIRRQRQRILRIEATAETPAGAGSTAALLREKLDTLAPYLTRFAPAMARTRVVPLVILAAALSQSWAMALVLLVAGPVIPLFMALIGRAAEGASAKHLAGVSTLSDLLVDRLAALPDIRILGAGDRVTAGFGEEARDLATRAMSVLRLAFLSSTVLELFAALGTAMTAVWVGFSLLEVINWGSWGGGLTPLGGIFLLLLVPDFFQPLRDLASAWHDRAAARAVAAEIATWEAINRPAILGGLGPIEGADGPATLAWRDLTARGTSYPDAVIAPGERVAITGPSGAGKSTLLSILAGLITPTTGEIEAGGRVLDTGNADDWRARIGWMPQTPRFPDAPLAEVIGTDDPEVLAQAQLTEVVARLPEGLATTLGETGAGLSGGEARRVLAARLIAVRPEVVLADEPTADLDAATARAITEAILSLAGHGATLIVATHDPALIARMDRVIEVRR
ncbi:ABC transporter ATP-binding protein/permease [uncultured Maritimibacter sp.]|uniref:ABC transporter ATP-binding protein/permease n=1 Tax=uncultured Maritimibacter sp. TaxID=991866 RepID=UPI0026208D1C|nr:ATP-binding cassette domain-containing protein [uncultured Maritimibacter sp.]